MPKLKFLLTIISISLSLVLISKINQSVFAQDTTESTKEATAVNNNTPKYAKKAYEYSKMMNEIRNVKQTRAQRLQSLFKAEHEHNEKLKDTKLVTDAQLKEMYGDTIDPTRILLLKNISNMSILTRIRYSIATEGFFKILIRVNKSLDEKENFCFDVRLHVSKLEDIEDLLINSNANAEAIIFQLPPKESLNSQYIGNEMARVKQSASETQKFYTMIQKELIKLIQSIQNG